MTERIVQWVLLREWHYLQNCLGFPIIRRYGENIATEHGVLDFVLLTTDANHPLLIIELETAIDSRGKLTLVQDQLQRYCHVSFPPYPSTLILLYAEDKTPPKLAQRLQTTCQQLKVLPRTYSLQEVQSRYQKIMAELIKTVGIPLGPTAAMDICYLRWMNTLIKPFIDQQVTELPVTVFFNPKGSGVFRSRTTYNVRKRLCEDFELIIEGESASQPMLVLTEYGKRFAEAMVPEILVGYSKIPPLSAEQKRILLEVLTNGIIRPCKANVYYFLRFVHITEGAWVPKPTAPEPQAGEEAHSYWYLATALFGKNYAWRTLTDFLAFTCNQCEELGLVDRLRLRGNYDRVVLTSLGSRVLGLVELDLHIKRERLQIPLHV